VLRLFRKRPRPREIYFHEDDYCQQQILPASENSSATEELAKISDFSREHRAPGGVGWTDIYVRDGTGPGFSALRMTLQQFEAAIQEFLPRFDTVHTGYSSYRQECKLTGAWGTSDSCCVFADWSQSAIIQNVWTSFFDDSEDSISRSASAVSALASHSPLVYIDWAWDYTVDPGNEEVFIRLLKDKLEAIAENVRSSKQDG
jgi:hypothetical protein